MEEMGFHLKTWTGLGDEEAIPGRRNYYRRKNSEKLESITYGSPAPPPAKNKHGENGK